VALDKSEGVVKTQKFRAVIPHRLRVRVVEDRSSETLTVNQLSAAQIVPPTIDTAIYYGHDSSIRIPA
jgi:hypothetical protein